MGQLLPETSILSSKILAKSGVFLYPGPAKLKTRTRAVKAYGLWPFVGSWLAVQGAMAGLILMN
jgi:hypothetical protein